ncbi:hypothetical protein EGW08_000467 [Elysia chlorotica]|uniref:Reverse transcriptase domain-containing protein n=1 Tax=Elysia chlorotica TaxID=188477 RepID=A0A433UD90_ELYCH|nr:hypothetical protein EGW08_000467 [Elysia chlorotica]
MCLRTKIHKGPELDLPEPRVWKDGLRLKLRKNGISGCMFKWISQYLSNRKARVHVNGTYSRKKTLREGVPQGGVLSPTLFLIFINDIVKDLPRNVHGAIYADDLVLWCSEEYTSTANYRLQEALNTLEKWTKQWLMTINSAKTTYTVFSLSTKKQKVTLKLNGQALPAEDNPTYLGVTFDKRLTWKEQTEKAEARAKARLAIMKKLAGTQWGANARILKTMYTGRVRPVLEYGVSAWGTAAKSNLDKITKVQNQATRVITGAMKSTPIKELETITGLAPIVQRKDSKLLIQAAKFRRLPEHPMKDRMSQPVKRRLKRESFLHQVRSLEKKNQDMQGQNPKELPRCAKHPAWEEETSLQIHEAIPGIGKKSSQNDLEKRSFAVEHIQTNYPATDWTHVYTDGSAEKAVRNGGAGIYIKYPGDALSVLQALKSSKNKDLNDLTSALTSLSQTHTIALQWIPSHCNVFGNETADLLAKKAAALQQNDYTTTYSEAKTIIHAQQHEEWLQEHPNHVQNDAYHALTRAEQVVIFRLRTGHNRLNHHLYTKLHIGTSDQCTCQTGGQTVIHVLQHCPMYENIRNLMWPQDTPMAQKLYGSLEDLRRTATFMSETGLSI